jgi:predicted aspartyl protease
VINEVSPAIGAYVLAAAAVDRYVVVSKTQADPVYVRLAVDTGSEGRTLVRMPVTDGLGSVPERSPPTEPPGGTLDTHVNTPLRF